MAALFGTPDEWTDVVFIVEGQEIHFNKTILSMCSPVFKTMFSANFKEKTERTIPLPEKKYKDMVMFFGHLHPLYSWKPIRDTDWEKLMTLADEYQVEHLKEKCEQHIESRISHLDRRTLALNTDSNNHTTFYLLMCERYKLSRYQSKLMDLVAWKSTKVLEKDEYFHAMSVQMQRDVYKLRCESQERLL